MNKEEKLLSEIFNAKWKKKYTVSWCMICDCAYITCPNSKCLGTSCNGAGCKECNNDFDEFLTYNIRVENYLTDKEKNIYHKCLRVKKHILETIPLGIKKIDWKKLNKQKKLSDIERKMFL